MANYSISTDVTKFDFDVIYNFVSESYWAKGIPRETMQKAIDNSLCFAVIKELSNGLTESVGFARMITDKATFAYLGDVFIAPDEQGQGLSKMLMKAISEHPDLQGLRRTMLATRDAHGLYKQFGFSEVTNPEILMQIHVPDIYKTQD